MGSDRLKYIYKIYQNKIERELPEPKGDYEAFLKMIKHFKKNQTKKYTPSYESGEIFLVDDFLFLLLGELCDDDKLPLGKYLGYPVSEFVEFATSDDIIFEFDDFKWVAITEQIVVPKEKLCESMCIGKVDEEYIQVFEDYFSGKQIDQKYTGLTIVHGDEGFEQVLFRQNELKKLRSYLMDYSFLVVEKKVYTPSELKNVIKVDFKRKEFLKAAATQNKIERGENYILKNLGGGLVSVILDDEDLKSKKVLKVALFNKEYLCYNENGIIELEFDTNFVNLIELKNNLIISDDKDN